MKDPIVHKSKHLSLVLRHQPESVGLTLDSAGWVEVAALLPAMKWSMDDLEAVVRDNNKKRFEFNEDKTRIRACQGHSVEVDLEYEEKEPPDCLYHGTSKDIFDVLEREGLKKMQRHHVHMSSDVKTALIVARRRRNPIVLEIWTDQMFYDGYKFFLSTNGVWLTDHVPSWYFQFVDLT
jgi:putative RNA 2'-phosphotransferase